MGSPPPNRSLQKLAAAQGISTASKSQDQLAAELTAGSVPVARQYGIKGDGTNESAALTAAISTVTARGGAVLTLPPGHFSLINVSVPAGFRLVGAGIGKTIVTAAGTTGAVFDTSLGGSVEHLTIVSAGGTARAVTDTNPDGAYRRSVLKRVRVEGFVGGMRAILSTGANGLLLDRIEADGCYIPIEILTPVGAVDILRPRLTNSAASTMCFGILVDTPSASPVVTGATVRINRPYIRGVNLDSTGYSAEAWGICVSRVLNVEVTHPDIQNCESPAYAPNTPGKEPSGLPTGGGILLGSRSFGFRLTGGDVIKNRVNVYVEQQPEAGTVGTQVQQGSDLGGLIDGVHIAYARGSGMSLSYGVSAMVKNCRIHDNGEDGAVTDADYVDFIGNTIYNNWQNRTTPPAQLVRAGIRTIGRFNKVQGNTLYDTQATPTQDYDIAIGENRGHRVGGNTGAQGNGTASVYEGTDFVSDGLTPNLFLDTDTTGQNASYLGTLVQQNNPAAALYYPIGTLPAPTAGDTSKIVVDVQGGAYDAGTVALDRFFFGSQGSFKSLFVPGGSSTAAAARAALSVVVYQNADLSYSVYAKTKAGGYIHGNVRAFVVPTSTTTTTLRPRTHALVLGKGVATVPSGTLVFDGSDPAYMPASGGTGPASMQIGGTLQVNNNAAAGYALVGTLPAPTVLSRMVVETEGGDYLGSNGLRVQRALLSNYSAFSYLHEHDGAGSQNLALVAYTQADNTVQVYVRVTASTYTLGVTRAYLLSGTNAPAPLTIGAVSTTVPSGTLVLDTADRVAYPANGKAHFGSLRLKPYTQATLPTASSAPDTIVYVTDPATGNSRLAYSDGTSWVYLPLTSGGTGSSGVPLGSGFQVNNAASVQYRLIATLPAGSSTLNKLVVETVSGGYNANTGLNASRVVMGAFGGFAYSLETAGITQSLSIVAYQQTDNTVQVFAAEPASAYISGFVRAYWQTGNYADPVTLTIGAATSTVPSGTLVLDTGNSASYPANIVRGLGTVVMQQKITAASAGNSTMFVDSADGKLKFKDATGAINLLY